MPFPNKDTQFKPGESGNPKGKPKGTKNLSTIIRELENEDYDWSLIPIKNKEAAQKFGAPWKAIVATALAKAYSGDIKAAEWLRKAGYGDKLTLDGELTHNIALVEFVGDAAEEDES